MSGHASRQVCRHWPVNASMLAAAARGRAAFSAALRSALGRDRSPPPLSRGGFMRVMGGEGLVAVLPRRSVPMSEALRVSLLSPPHARSLIGFAQIFGMSFVARNCAAFGSPVSITGAWGGGARAACSGVLTRGRA